MLEAYRIIVVEDSDREYGTLQHALESYEHEKGLSFTITRFTSIEEFLTAYRGNADLIFLDIQLPGMNGMEGAERLRRLDRSVALVFVTNLAQYAVNGYEVDALDYIVKPLSIKKLYYVMDKALQRAESNVRQKRVTIRNVSSFSSVYSGSITYVEVMGHHMTVHLTDGKEMSATGSLTTLYEELKDYGFERCNSCYLVNMRYIEEVRGDVLKMTSGQELLISKRKKKDFTDRFMDYLSLN